MQLAQRRAVGQRSQLEKSRVKCVTLEVMREIAVRIAHASEQPHSSGRTHPWESANRYLFNVPVNNRLETWDTAALRANAREIWSIRKKLT